MISIASTRGYVLALLCVASPIAACGSSTSPGGGAGASSSTADEAARVQSFLDSRYTRDDVRHSFRTKFGDDVDCVDFFAEPSVRAMAAMGKPITEIPKPPPIPEAMRRREASQTPVAPEDGISLRGQLDEQGRPQACPAGSIPEMRITPERIARAGGLDAFLAASGKKLVPPPPDRCGGEEYAGYAHVKATVVNDVPPLEYGGDTMAIYAPTVPIWESTADHALSQIWFYTGNHAVPPLDPVGCNASDCYNTIEFGWQVNAQLNPGDGQPRLFIGSTNNGYASFCFNNGGTDCVQYVPTNSYYYLNQPLGYVPPGDGTPNELEVVIIEISNAFWITMQHSGEPSEYIGYFPAGQYQRPMDTFEVGGEVYDQTGAFAGQVEMGSGQDAYSGYGNAAYHYAYAGDSYVNGESVWSWGGPMCNTHPTDYDYVLNSGGQSSWAELGDYFFYGDCTPKVCPILSRWDATTCNCVRAIRIE
jgi:Neprosin